MKTKNNAKNNAENKTKNKAESKAKKIIKASLLYGGASLAGSLLVLSFWFIANAGRAKTQDYATYDLSRPWFDGEKWDWFLDMFNMASIKPQEEGSVQNFPLESVPRSGREPFIPATAVVGKRLLRDILPHNPLTAKEQLDPQAIARGEILYLRYCAVCHGADGKAKTALTSLGMPAPALPPLLSLLSDARIYNIVRYGGGIMPSYSHQTSQTERWEIISYLRSDKFKLP